MSPDSSHENGTRLPTRREAFVFRGKTALLQLRRALTDLRGPTVRKLKRSQAAEHAGPIAESVTKLWTESEASERRLVAGKIHNLRLAVNMLDGKRLPAGEIFSFWKQIGRVSRRRGFVPGRELREGCIIPNVGGGLCQLSNALYDAAVKAGLEIIERHAHTQVVAGSLAETGRDATVFWNYVDLRFRSSADLYIDARLDGENLTVRYRGDKRSVQNGLAPVESRPPDASLNSCASCEVNDCFRVATEPKDANFGKAAYLVDEFTPEFDRFLQGERSADDVLLMPIDGRRMQKANYAWTTRGFGDVKQSVAVTIARSIRSRKLAAQGAARQLNLLKMYEKLAESYARRLSFDVVHVTVQQDLLPFLWAGGHLGGRTFDVLMTALPMRKLQKRLDLAAALHPGSPTLSDFRAESWIIEAEEEALRHARRIVSPHSDIIRQFPRRGHKLAWNMPAASSTLKRESQKPSIVLPAATVGRKGCYELREAVRGMDVQLVILGPNIESGDFWNGFDTVSANADWLSAADLVVLPAFVEHRPRRLLQAAAAGIPVIASPACGVEDVAGITTVAAGNAAQLRKAIDAALAR